ncbi:MAG: exodeoxyribonuclease VII small subunit [Gemmatimonadetes bacterium]|nr:exodeoxyribonuclease VII small subunit [Gemmatimonadota bacterium]
MPSTEPNPTLDAQPLRLGAVLTRLDQIRRELDRDDLDLEDQLVLYREGVTHVAAARRILEASRAEVELLAEEGEGAGG